MRNLFCFAFLLAFFSCSLSGKKELGSLIRNVGQKYVPDKRDNVYDIEMKEVNGETVLAGYTSVPEAKAELLSIAGNIIDSIIVLPDASVGDSVYGIINVSVADIRTGKDYSAEMATQALLGMPIRLLQEKKWWRIRTAENYLGWTTGSSFVRMDESSFNEWIGSEKIIFTGIYGFSYEQPDNKSQTVSDLVFGNLLRFLGEEGNFYKVSYPNGNTAYVLKTESKPFNEWFSSVELTEESIIEKALLLKGIPYTWGGTSTKMMDCSGFTKTVFLMNGVVLLRDASQQVNTGIPVDITNGYENLQKGDLMFFGKKGSNGKKDRIRHVGIYLGNNEFIHEAGLVRIASLDPAKANYDELNTLEFVQARRIIGAVGTEGIMKLDEIMTKQ